MSYHINGKWNKTAQSPHFSNKMSVSGWKLYWLGPIKTENQNNTIIDYGVAQKQKKVQILGEIREIIKKSKK